MDSIQLITPPATEPLSIGWVKTRLRIPDSNDDLDLLEMIKAAREECEKSTSRALITQTWKITLGHFPFLHFHDQVFSDANHWNHRYRSHHGHHPYAIHLPKSPVNTVSVQYLDTDGVLQTFDSSQYVFMHDDLDAWIEPAANCYWPITLAQSDAVRITIDCGYGDDMSKIPSILKQAMLLLVGHWNEHREEWILTQARAVDVQIPFGALRAFRSMSIKRF